MPIHTAASAAALLALAGAALAQPADDADQQPPAKVTDADTKADPAFQINLGARHFFEADLDTGPGELSTTRAAVGAAVTLFPADRTRLTFAIDATESWYDFSGATGLHASGEPFDNATEIDLSAAFSAPLNDTTNYFVSALVGYAAESGADFSDSLVYGGNVGFVTRQSDTFSWGLGVAVRTRLEDDALVIPLPQITWKLSDRWVLATQRGGVTLDYDASESLNYGLGIQFDTRTFRLDETGPIPAGVASEERVPLFFYATYKPNPTIEITAEAGATVYSNIELFDSVGNELVNDDVDPAIFLGLTGRIRF